MAVAKSPILTHMEPLLAGSQVRGPGCKSEPSLNWLWNRDFESLQVQDSSTLHGLLIKDLTWLEIAENLTEVLFSLM
ncbi:Protein Tamalin [Manis pentadactyla]|nr:Protein Tamalin [Manis pentadactyla]